MACGLTNKKNILRNLQYGSISNALFFFWFDFFIVSPLMSSAFVGGLQVSSRKG